jgi:hypothetical protein
MRKPVERIGIAGSARIVRRAVCVCLLGLMLGACEGSNMFEPCDPDGDTPHTACGSAT